LREMIFSQNLYPTIPFPIITIFMALNIYQVN
jgi:hypothetical protein